MNWINVNERLPKIGEHVLATNGKTMCVCAYDNHREYIYGWPIVEGEDGYNLNGVTHWMPLPKPPVA